MAVSSYTPQQLRDLICAPNWIVRMEAGGDKSRASNPCQTRFNAIQYFLCYPMLLPIALFVGAAVGIIGGWYYHFGWTWTVAMIVALPLLFILKLITLQMKRFIYGDVCPACVLDEAHLATFINLSATGGQVMNAIKITVAPVGRFAGGPYRKGDRVPAVCLYTAPADSDGAWKDVSPLPVAAGTRNAVALARLMDSISEENWAEAKRNIRSGQVQSTGSASALASLS